MKEIKGNQRKKKRWKKRNLNKSEGKKTDEMQRKYVTNIKKNEQMEKKVDT